MTTFDKALVAAIMGILSLVNVIAGHDVFGPNTEQYITSLVAVITPLLVYFVPNVKKD